MPVEKGRKLEPIEGGSIPVEFAGGTVVRGESHVPMETWQPGSENQEPDVQTVKVEQPAEAGGGGGDGGGKGKK